MHSVLVTGGSGAFGQAFIRRLLALDVERIAVLSRSESRQAVMKSTFTDPRLRYLIGDVRDLPRLMFACHGIDTVIHAAALKRIEVCESDPYEAVETNIRGTENVARACIANSVRRAVFLSTDKAAAPNTLYGATKLTAERIWLASNVYAAGRATRFSATRYGNVLGSTGSVVPMWREQAKTGRISVTDPTMTRFLMTLDDAVSLVLLTVRDMRGGEVFVPKIGATDLGTLAKAIAPSAEWSVTGLRPGEKMHEMLVSADESRHTYDAMTHYIIEPGFPLWETREALTLPKVPDRFEYRSDTVQQLTVEEIREMAA